MKVNIREVNDGDLKIFIDGEEVFYDHDHNLLNFLPNLLNQLGHEVIKDEHEWSY